MNRHSINYTHRWSSGRTVYNSILNRVKLWEKNSIRCVIELRRRRVEKNIHLLNSFRRENTSTFFTEIISWRLIYSGLVLKPLHTYYYIRVRLNKYFTNHFLFDSHTIRTDIIYMIFLSA